MKDQIKDFAVKVIGMTDDEVQSLFKKTDENDETLVDNFHEILAQKDGERIRKIKESINEAHKTELTTIHDKGYQKAAKQERQKLESEIREKFGVQSDKIGVDLVKDIVDAKSQSTTTDDIKTHPDYIKLERKLNTEFVPKTDYDKVNETFEEFKKGVEKDKTVDKVKEDARKHFRGLNPILSKDPKRAANQEAEFLKKLENFDYQVQEDGNHLIMKDGQRLENQNMNPIPFSEFIKDKTLELFDVAAQGERGNSGVDGGASEGQAFTFKDVNDYDEKYNAETDPEKRVKLFEAAEKQGLI